MKTQSIRSFLLFLISCFLLSMATAQSQTETDLKPKVFAEKLKQLDNEVILDVRADWEYQGGHLRDAVNIDVDGKNFDIDVAKLDKNKPYLLYCYSGGRSSFAARKMRKLGFIEVYELDGGIEAWMDAGLPVTKD